MPKDNETQIIRPFKGLYSDCSPEDQPEGTYRFALNAVDGSMDGDENSISNEEGNEIFTSYKSDYIPLGRVYIGDNQIAILSISKDEIWSEIGILDIDKKSYTTHVNSDTLGFKLSHQIDIVYRLRRGCEKTIYFTTPVPMIYNFSKPENFKSDNEWNKDKFKLFRSYNKIPVINSVEITESGQLPPGSYNLSIQYMDEDLNLTEVVTTTDTIVVFNDNMTSKEFQSIRGSTNKINEYQNFGNTSKAININVDNLDTSFPYYRIGIIESNNGSGEVSRIVFSNPISTLVHSYSYDGTNFTEEGTEAEISTFQTAIDSAEHIEQDQNRLLLGNTKGKQIRWCKLQKYASRIKSDLVTETIILNDITSPNNPKRPQLHLEKVGYMPGEIYSFGIIYLFADGSMSPVYHIPGRAEDFYSKMSLDNTSLDRYSNEDWWGMDNMGNYLKNTPIRHHRFPLRSEVGKPLIVTEGTSSIIDSYINRLVLDISGTIRNNYEDKDVTYLVTFTVNGNSNTIQRTIRISSYNKEDGIEGSLIYSSVDEITDISIQEIDPTDHTTPITPDSGLSYTSRIVEEKFTSSISDKVYKSEIFGIKFFNIDIPSIEDTGGNEIVGYYIVRNERKNSDKTILDSAVLFPTVEETGKKSGTVRFVASGMVTPNTSRVKEDIWSIISPEHKFNGRENTGITEILKEGHFNIDNKIITTERIEDVSPGTTYIPGTSKKREKDSDGFDLLIFSRNTEATYIPSSEEFANEEDIDSVFYLDALFSNSIKDYEDNRRDVFNNSADNKIGILQLKSPHSYLDRLPYVIFKRDLINNYTGFRTIPYYKETQEPIGVHVDSVSIFHGDSYISPMTYISSMYHDTRLRYRKQKSGIGKFIMGGLSILAGVLTTVGTLGLGTPAGIAMIGFGVSQVSAGIKQAQMNKVYNDLYEQGLKDTVDDDDTDPIMGEDINPVDDQIEWVHDCVRNLWFESSVNMNWRSGATAGITDFINSPSEYNEQEILQYYTEKLTTIDPEANEGRNYQGFAKSEIYDLNDDYKRREKQKFFFALGLEYDCSSACVESFPHRIHYSEQSFQEELSDNYRVFLPNNYKDIEGDTGEITNIFKYRNNIFIHTSEGLWKVNANIQERVVGEIVSYLGTGDFLSIPPVKIVDDDTGNSAGSISKEATIITPFGAFFICNNQSIVYQLTEKGLNPISGKGLRNFFKNNMKFKANEASFNSVDEPFPGLNNPSNPDGVGYVSVYDSRRERIIVTKKDFLYNILSENPDNGYYIEFKDGDAYIYRNYEEDIDSMEALGWTYEGTTNGKLKFSRITEKEKEDIDTTPIEIANEADVVVAMDMSGSFDITARAQIKSAIIDWYNNYKIQNPLWEGNLYFFEHPSQDVSEKYLRILEFIDQNVSGFKDINNDPVSASVINKDLVVVSMINENDTDTSGQGYHPSSVESSISAPTTAYDTDLRNFELLYNQRILMGGSFKALLYPIVHSGVANTAAFLQHVLAAIKGGEYSISEINTIPKNPSVSDPNWATIKNSLTEDFSWELPGLNTIGWSGIYNRGWEGSGNVITAAQFQDDMSVFLKGTSEEGNTIITVKYLEEETTYIDGERLSEIDDTKIDYSWTLSYSLKYEFWRSFHSYLPNIYLSTPDKYFSWSSGDISFIKYNSNKYQTYSGNLKPFIIEFVSNEASVVTKTWESMSYISKAYKDKIEAKLVTFNKVLFYNERQCSGILSLKVKDSDPDSDNYLFQQVRDIVPGEIILDKNEKNWSLNDFRDNVVDPSLPLFINNKKDIQEDYYIDKIVNTQNIDFNKDWEELEKFRDKYLIVRLIFDNFDDVKLLFRYSFNNKLPSFR